MCDKLAVFVENRSLKGVMWLSVLNYVNLHNSGWISKSDMGLSMLR